MEKLTSIFSLLFMFFFYRFRINIRIEVHFLCHLRSIATQGSLCRSSVRLSVRPSVCLSHFSVTLSKAMFRRRHMHSSECCHYFCLHGEMKGHWSRLNLWTSFTRDQCLFISKCKQKKSVLQSLIEYYTDQPVQRILIKLATNVAQQERIKCRDFGVQRSKVNVTVQCRQKLIHVYMSYWEYNRDQTVGCILI